MEDRKVVVVTGANKGIGLAVAEHLASEGYVIAACVRTNSVSLDALLEKNPEHKVFILDLAEDQSVKNCAKELLSWAGQVYGLVNCAGLAAGGLFSMTRIEDMRNLFAVNLFGQILLSQYVAKKMVRAKAGCIVNIASTAGILADPGTLAYGGSKAALIHATKVMASELGAFGIRVNAIAPSVVKTDMAELMDEKSRLRLDDRSAIAGMIETGDVADLVGFLMSEKSKKLTGQIIRLDRGMPF